MNAIYYSWIAYATNSDSKVIVGMHAVLMVADCLIGLQILFSVFLHENEKLSIVENLIEDSDEEEEV